jgi:hypothetical protein
MKTIDITISTLCEEIDLLKVDRDLWKNKYEECNKRFGKFVDQSIENGDATSRNWVLYILNCLPQKKYKIASELAPGYVQLRSQIFDSWDECQKECEKLDVAYPTIRHWPEEV